MFLFLRCVLSLGCLLYLWLWLWDLIHLCDLLFQLYPNVKPFSCILLISFLCTHLFSYLVLQSKYFGVYFGGREHRFAPQRSPVTSLMLFSQCVECRLKTVKKKEKENSLFLLSHILIQPAFYFLSFL